MYVLACLLLACVVQPTRIRPLLRKHDLPACRPYYNREQAREFGGVVIILLYVLFIYPFSYPSSAAAGCVDVVRGVSCQWIGSSSLNPPAFFRYDINPTAARARRHDILGWLRALVPGAVLGIGASMYRAGGGLGVRALWGAGAFSCSTAFGASHVLCALRWGVFRSTRRFYEKKS